MRKKSKIMVILGSVCLMLIFVGSSLLAYKPVPLTKVRAEAEKHPKRDIVIKVMDWFARPDEEYLYEKPGKLLLDAEGWGGSWNALWQARQYYQTVLFQYQHPGVRVVGTHFAWWSAEKTRTALASGTMLSEIVEWTVGDIHSARAEGIAADITDYVGDLKERFVSPRVWDRCWYKGRCYGIPDQSTTHRMILYRRDWFKEAGIFNEKGDPGPPLDWSIEDLGPICKKLRNPKKNRWGFALPAASTDNPADATRDFELLCRIFGAPLVKPDPTGKYTWRAAFNSPETIKVLEYYRDLIFKYNAYSSAEPFSPWGGFVNDLKFAMVGGTDNNTFYMCATRKNVELFGPGKDTMECWGQAVWPKGPQGLIPDTENAPAWLVNSMQSKEQIKATTEWLKYIYAGRGATLYVMNMYDAGREIPYQVFPPTYKIDLPAGVKPWKEYYPDYLIEPYEKVAAIPIEPKMVSYEIPLENINGFREDLVPLLQAAVTQPDADLQKLANKYAEHTNKTVLNYKIEDQTKENFKKYYTDLGNFYKKYYPEYYNKVFLNLLEKYYKIW